MRFSHIIAGFLLTCIPAAVIAQEVEDTNQSIEIIDIEGEVTLDFEIDNSTVSDAAGPTVIYRGRGDATYYYDITGSGPCPGGPYPETNGYATCESWQGTAYPLSHYRNNYIVAIPNHMLRTNQQRAALCGKQVIAYVDGRQVNTARPLVIWDGCEACNGNGGLDFSSTAMHELFGSQGCNLGRIKGRLSYDIINQQLMRFNP